MRRIRRPTSGTPRAGLLARLPKGGVGAEIGSWKGNFAARILEVARPTRLFLIDPWEHRTEEEYQHAMYGGDRPGGQPGMEAIYQSVLERFQGQIEAEQVVVLRMASMRAASEFEDGSLDFVYIDGDHTYESVKQDLDLYERIVKPGGVLTGDDYGDPGWWDNGVTKAVDEFAASGPGRTPEIIGNQFLIKRPREHRKWWRF